jgi:hypothetical protein
MIFFLLIPALTPLVVAPFMPGVVGLVGRLGVPVRLSVCERVVRVCIGLILLEEFDFADCMTELSVLSELDGLREFETAGEFGCCFSLCNVGGDCAAFIGSFLKHTAHCQANPFEGFRLRGGLTQPIW